VTSGSKEIAAILGIEPGTVDHHIKAAVKALGENSRHAAARKFATLEADAPPQKLDSQSPAIAEPATPLPPEAAGADGQRPDADWTIREEQAPFVVEFAPVRGTRWPFATRGRPRNDYTWGETLMASVGLSVGLATAAGSVIAGVVLLMNFLISVSRHGG
jgi:hypothetical protein